MFQIILGWLYGSLCLLQPQAITAQQPVAQIRSLYWTTIGRDHTAWIRAKFTDDQSYLFLVDTAAPNCTLDPKIIKQRQIPLLSKNFGKTTIEFVRSPVNLGPDMLTVSNQEWLPFDMSTFRRENADVAGFLGLSFLDRTALRFDFALKKLDVIYPGNVAGTENEPKDATRIPLIERDGYYVVEGLMDGKAAQFILDTGAEQSIINVPDLLAQLKPAGSIEGAVSIASDINGKQDRFYTTRKLRFKTVKVGNIEWKEPVFEQPMNAERFKVLTLGVDFLRRFRVLVDLPGKMLYLTPDRAYQTDELEWVGSGVVTGIDTDKKVLVIAILKPSPAQDTDIRVNDEIVLIDGRAVRGLTIQQVDALNHKPEGTEITYTVRHRGDTQLREYKLKVKKLL